MAIRADEITAIIKDQIRTSSSRLRRSPSAPSSRSATASRRSTGSPRRASRRSWSSFPTARWAWPSTSKRTPSASSCWAIYRHQGRRLVRSTGRIAQVPVGDALSAAWSTRSASRSTAKGRSAPSKFRAIERIAPGVITRQSVNTPVQTGIKAIDAMIPIGRGQRELIIGDRQTGKTAIALDTIINQKGNDLICIYVAIGQKHAKVAQVVAHARGSRRDGVHHRRRGHRLRPGRRCSTSRPTPAARSAKSSWRAAATR